jgi:hypothetical protein
LPSRPAAATGAQPSLFDQNLAMPLFNDSIRSITSEIGMSSIDCGVAVLMKVGFVMFSRRHCHIELAAGPLDSASHNANNLGKKCACGRLHG